ncbi:MAG: sec-independent protein translocase protein TatB [Granulosicoccus sp.]
MFDIGFTELMLIGIVALVVIGPERLPAVAKTAGQWLAKVQRFVRGVKTDLASELETGDLKKLLGDQREQINELKNMVTTVKKDFETSSQTIVKDAKSKLDDMETSAKKSEGSSSSQSTAQASTASTAATLSSPTAAGSAESIDEASLDDAADTQREFETLDGQTVSIDKTDDTSDIGRTGS